MAPRLPTTLTDAEIDTYLDARSEWAIFTTIGPDGYPHSVPLGYFRVGADLVLGMKDGTQKVKNVERHRQAAVLVTTAKARGDITGVLVQGEASVVREPGDRLRLAQEAARRRGVAEADLPQAVSPDGVYVRVARRRVISWRYPKSAQARGRTS